MVGDMHCLECPYCKEKAAPLLKTYFWGYFPGNQPKRCQRCFGSIEYNLNSYFICGALFFTLLILFGYYVAPLFPFLSARKETSSVVVELQSFNFIGLGRQVCEAVLVLSILYISFELPAKYFGIRIYKKRA